jgi:riboflavin kinase / FMN adenylyltransferase
MKVFHGTQQALGKIPNAVVTTGSFDGVHIGHKVIINRLNQIAREINGQSVLITFHPHPRKILFPLQKDLKLINSQEEKIELLRKAGLDNLIIIPFSLEFSKTTSQDFVSRVLIGHLNAKVIVVGHNHHFGHNRQGDFSYLDKLSNQYGFEVETIPLQDIENETVSSTKIRKALIQGNIQRANAYLDHQYIIKGLISNGSGVMDLSTFSMVISEEEKLIPPPGIYASSLMIEEKSLKSMTFILQDEENKSWLETHLLDTNKLPEDINYGTIYFYKKISALNLALPGSANKEEIMEARENIEELIY